jgi:hypothetical protein
LHSICEDCVIAQLDGRNDNRKIPNPLVLELEENATQQRPTPPGVIKCPSCSQVNKIYAITIQATKAF